MLSPNTPPLFLISQTGFSAVRSPSDSFRRTPAHHGACPLRGLTAEPATFPKGRSGQAELLPGDTKCLKFEVPKMPKVMDYFPTLDTLVHFRHFSSL
ncbi:hypothetical protein ES703_67405 [subsurface metagenome]